MSQTTASLGKMFLGACGGSSQGHGELLLAQNNTTADFLESCYVLDGFIGVGISVGASRRRKESNVLEILGSPIMDRDFSVPGLLPLFKYSN